MAKAVKRAVEAGPENVGQGGASSSSGAPGPPTSPPVASSSEKRKRDPEDRGDQDAHLETDPKDGSTEMDIEPVACEEPLDSSNSGMVDGYFKQDDLAATDDVSGKPLDPAGVRTAREDELRELERLKVYDVVDLEECWRLTGRAPITAKWIDTNKGSETNPKYRSRFVAREIKSLHGGNSREDLFAATPPWEAVKILLSDVVTDYGAGHRRKKLMFIDISKAYLFAPVTVENLFVDLPPEQAIPGKCGKLKKALYGTRDAAWAWEIEYSRTLLDMGFVPGKSSTVVFYNPELDIRLVVHGDDFVLSGEQIHLERFAAQLKEKYLVKIRGILGPDRNDQKVISILNRIVEWTELGLQIEADPKHVKTMLDDLDLQNANGSSVTGSKLECGE